MDIQWENLWCVACLDAVALALPSVTGNDAKIRARYSQDCATILGVGIEGALLGLC